jgi:hypothetical protein
VTLTHEVQGSTPCGGTKCGHRNAQGGIPAAPLHLGTPNEFPFTRHPSGLPLECDGFAHRSSKPLDKVRILVGALTAIVAQLVDRLLAM